MKQIFIVKPDTLSATDKQKLSKAGFVIILVVLLLSCNKQPVTKTEGLDLVYDSISCGTGFDATSDFYYDSTSNIILSEPFVITLINGNNAIVIDNDSIYWNGRAITGDTVLANALRKFLFTNR